MRLDKAEAESYDRRIIEEQRCYADTLLCKAIRENMENMKV